MGVTSVSWSEIDAWLRVTQTNLSVWEKITLKEMSEAYAAELVQATAKTHPAPYTEEVEVAQVDRDEVAKKLKSVFSSFKRNAKPQD